MEVVYTGLHRRPDEVVATAVDEDVDVIGVSILSGAHMTLLPRIAQLMRDRGIRGETALVVGGVIPDEDLPALEALGVAAIVGQETTPDEIVEAVRRAVADRQPTRA